MGIFRQVILPPSSPRVGAGVLVVLLLALGFYIETRARSLYRRWSPSKRRPSQLGHAATLSAVLLATALGLIVLAYRLPGVGHAFWNEPAMQRTPTHGDPPVAPVTIGLILLFLAFRAAWRPLYPFCRRTTSSFHPGSALKWYVAYCGGADWLQTDVAQYLGRDFRGVAANDARHAGRDRHHTPAAACARLYCAYSRYGQVVLTTVSAGLARIDPMLERAALNLDATRHFLLVGALFAFITSFYR